jgi:hypothetical protein
MATSSKRFPKIHDWTRIKTTYQGGDMLLGNGASCAVWRGFSYNSLLKQSGLPKPDLALFAELGTPNFEEALERLAIAELLCRQVGEANAADEMKLRYDRIKASLVSTVSKSHVDFTRASSSINAIATELTQYERVFSTSYDLILYWAINQQQNRFGDGFDSTGFIDAAATAGRTMVYWLHGGLHLRTTNGDVEKLKNTGQNINTLLQKSARLPMFIAEGTSQSKRLAISRSPYLSTVNAKLACANPKPLVVFGHALNNEDKHVRDTIKLSGQRKIAISIHNRDTAVMGRLIKEFPSCIFFDSATHPLGDSSLLVP